MSGMGGPELFITIWGRRGNHQQWRIRWNGKPHYYADATGPEDTLAAYLTLTEDVLNRLPWQYEPGSPGLLQGCATLQQSIRQRDRYAASDTAYKRKVGEPLP